MSLLGHWQGKLLSALESPNEDFLTSVENIKLQEVVVV
jgi:hypothetical protein